MTLKLRRLAPGSILLGLAWLWASVPLSCANSSATDTDGGSKKGGHHSKDASATEEAGPCGTIGEECCEPPTPCDIGAFCAPDGTCKNQHPPDIGQPCSSPSSCSSGICGYTQGIMDGSTPAPDGNGTPPPQPTGCTVGCYSTTPDCTPGWTCQQLTVGEGVCACNWSPEICDGKDNNCDGIIDNEPEADNYCTMMDEGIPQECVKGACQCVTTCSEECVNVKTDPNNCGKCGNACKPVVEKCNQGTCGCAYTLCGTDCVNTSGKDNMNCGGCGIICAYECNEGVCGPTTLATGLEEPASIVADATNVYFLAYNSSFVPEVEYCAVTGCGGTPTSLATSALGFGEVDSLGQLVISGTTIYFNDGEEDIDECHLPPAGCGGVGTVYGSGFGGYSLSMAAGTSDLAWSNESSETVSSCALGATCPTAKLLANTSASDVEPLAAAVSGSTVYFGGFDFETDVFTVQSVPIGGGALTTICSTASFLEELGQMIVVVAGPATSLYFTGGFESGVYYCDATKTGQTATMFFDDTNEPEGLASDGVNLYWTEESSAGAIMKCALGATCPSPTTLVAGQSEPYGIAVNATQVFWTTQGSTSGVFVFHN